MEKTAYISPELAELTLTIIRDANPVIVLTLDLGLPTYFPHFEIKLPLPDASSTQTAKLVRDALGGLLDEVISFMQSMGYDREVQIQVYAMALQCLESITNEAESEYKYPDYIKDSTVKTYEGTFMMPQAFIDETQKHVVTAAVTVKRQPQVRRIELTKLPPPKTKATDAERLIRMYRDRSLVTQPHRLYVMVYDQVGNTVGVIPVQNLKNPLLKRVGTMERDGTLVATLKGLDGKAYKPGHAVKVVPQGDFRVEIKDAATGTLIAKANVKEIAQIAQ